MTRPRYRPWFRMPRAGRHAPAARRGRGLLLSALLGVGLALLVIAALDNALRPVVTTLAQAKTENVVTGIINDAVMETLSAEAVAYQDLVTLERDSSGQVALLSTNSAKMNALRTQILQMVLEKVDSLDSRDLGIPLREGVYMYFPGPQYETPAEVRFARVAGADAVGMSTAPEVIVAGHCGMQVLGFTLVSNLAAGILDQPLSEQEVLDAAEACKDKFSRLVLACLERI